MAGKDRAEKLLEDYNDVFADIYNTLLFREPYLKEEHLKDGATESVYKAESGDLKQQHRDILKKYETGMFCICSLGIENQSAPERDMPVRVMGYDYGSYRSQLAAERPLAPVVTIVLNFSDQRWNHPKSICGLMDIPEKLRPFVEDYRIKVFDIAFLDDAVIDCFTSDFKVVARFFKNKRAGRQAEVSQDRQTLVHVEALMDLFSVFTKDNRYREAYESTLKFMVERGEAVEMCSVIDYYIEKGMEQGMEKGMEQGMEKGMERGLEEGRQQEAREMIGRMLRAGKTPEQIAEFCGYPMAQVESVQEALLQKA